MSRNVESHFALNPSDVDVKRSIFDRTSDIKTTFNVGDLVPFYVDEVLPGDTFSVDSTKVVRLQTPKYPLMDNLYLDYYYFFVPARLTWDHWKEFMGENSSSAWIPKTEYRIPQLCVPYKGSTEPKTMFAKSLADYMGIPPEISQGEYQTTEDCVKNGLSVSALPFRAYALICNEWFRDENLTDPLVVDTSDKDDWFCSDKSENYITAVARGGAPFKVAKFHDYFTSALPSPQKHDPVPIGDSLSPVFATDEMHGKRGFTGKVAPISFSKDPGLSAPINFLVGNNSNAAIFNPDSATSFKPFSPNNLWSYNMIDVNDLRISVALQHFYELDARGGTRYKELLKAHFGVTSPDARLQRPEYLGGNRVPVNISQVVQQSGDTSDTKLGDVAAYSQTVDAHNDFTQSFTEHGFVIGVMCCRYDHSYQQGVERFWSRKNREDFYFPVFANIGEQPIRRSEIYWNSVPGENDAVFGYQEAWADYRYKPNRVSAEMRSSYAQSLDAWHLADDYSSSPFLSDAWIREDKANLDRCLTVTSDVSDQLFCDILVSNRTTRPMPMFSIPGLDKL